MTSEPRKPLTVINLWAGPGAGKSTTAAGLFSLMKTAGYRVEYVPEAAKDLTYGRDYRRLQNQLGILSAQYERLDRVAGEVDYAITDSPLPIGLAYANAKWDTPAFREVVRQAWSHFDNVSFLVERVKPYQQYGRIQSEEEARHIDAVAAELMREFQPERERRFLVVGNDHADATILARLRWEKIIP